jgi:predicted DNA-binding protein YlxM (UPF0122 family)
MEYAENASSAIINKIKRLQEVLDRYDSKAETYQINQKASLFYGYSEDYSD